MPTIETESKVLDVNPQSIAGTMKKIGAKQVYDDFRTITYFDHADGSLKSIGEGVKLTEEDKLKLEYTRKSPSGQSDSVKLFVSRKVEAVEFLRRVGLLPITQVRARRISYELGTIDFDIDCFPGIPPFIEVDAGDATVDLSEIIKELGLEEKEAIIATTPEIFARYGKDYFAEFALEDVRNT